MDLPKTKGIVSDPEAEGFKLLRLRVRSEGRLAVSSGMQGAE